MSRPIHICILTSVHPVDDVRVSHKMAQAFRSAGFRVSWVGPDRAFYDKRNYDRYGIEYCLFPAGKGKLGRLCGLYRVYRGGPLVPDADVYYSPDPDAAVAAVRLGRKRKARVIFDIHEHYHGPLLDRWLKGPLVGVARKKLHSWILNTCSSCDLVIGVNHSVLEPYSSVATEKMVIRSCAPAWFGEGAPSTEDDTDRSTFMFMHGKALPSRARGTGVVLEALRLARPQIPGLKCLMFDTGDESSDGAEVRQKMASLGLRDVVVLRPGVPMQEMPQLLRSCDAGLISYDRTLGNESLPNRLFEYMAAGLPIIAPSYSPEICRILESERCGMPVDFEKPEALAAAMVSLYQQRDECREMGRRGQEAFHKRHNWQVEVQPLLARIRSWYPSREIP